MRQTIRGCAIAILGLSLACSSNKSPNPPGTTPDNVTITGQLQSGSVSGTAPEEGRLIARESAVAVSGPLSGYALYCVTFGSPASAASGTADAAGNVSVTIAAKGVAFGCFVQDSAGTTVATLSFKAASTTGGALTLSGSANLGTITVDLNTGLASASVSAGTGTVAANPAGVSCPLGNWVVDTGATKPACSSISANTTAKIWVAPTANGGCCTVSLTHGPENHGGGADAGSAGCTYGSWGGMPGIYASGTLNFGPFNGNTGGYCPNQITVQLTPNADCTSATGTVRFQGCLECGTLGNACSESYGPSGPICGTNACNFPVTATRQ